MCVCGCVEICNVCPLCKQKVKQIAHWGSAGRPSKSEVGEEHKAWPGKEERRAGADHSHSHGGASGSSATSGVKEEERKEGWPGSADASDAAMTWDDIQFQRAANLRQRRQTAARRSSGLFNQLSLEQSPAALSESLDALTAIATQQPTRLTRSMVKQQGELSRTGSSGVSQPHHNSPLSHRSQSQPQPQPQPLLRSASSSASASATAAWPPAGGMLVVDIPDRAQRPAYSEDLPSPSILNITCEQCHTDVDEQLLLLCDGCDDAYHTYCLVPQLDEIPDDEWFCPLCQWEEQVRLAEEMQLSTGAQTGDHLSLSLTPPRRPYSAQRRPRSQPRRRRTPSQQRPPRQPVFAPYEVEEVTAATQEEEEEEDGEGDAEGEDEEYRVSSHASHRAERAARRASQRVESLRAANLDLQRQRQDEARMRSLNTRVHTEHNRTTRLQTNQRIIAHAQPSVPASCAASSSSSSSSTASPGPFRSAPSPSFAGPLHSSPTSLHAPPVRAPSSSLSRLSTGSEDGLPTLAARMRELQLQKQREREAQRERETSQWRERGMVETLLEHALQARKTDTQPQHRQHPQLHNTTLRDARAAKRGRNEVHHRVRQDEVDTFDGDGDVWVRRKIPRKADVPDSRSLQVRAAASPSPASSPLSFSSLRSSSTSPSISWSSMQPSAQTTRPTPPPSTMPTSAHSHRSQRVSPPSALAHLPLLSSSSLASLPSSRAEGISAPSASLLSSSPSATPAQRSSAPPPSASQRAIAPHLSKAALGPAASRGSGQPPSRASDSSSSSSSAAFSSLSAVTPSRPTALVPVVPSFDDFLRRSTDGTRLSRSPYRSPPSPQPSARHRSAGGQRQHDLNHDHDHAHHRHHRRLKLSRDVAPKQQKSVSAVYLDGEDDGEDRPPSPFLQ